MEHKTNCFLCENSAVRIDTDGDFIHIKCHICGDIFVTGSFYATEKCKNLSDKEKIALRYYFKTSTISRKSNPYYIEKLATYNFESIINSVPYPSSLLDKINSVLEYISIKTDFFGQKITISNNDYPLFFCRDEKELKEIISYLIQNNLLNLRNNIENQNLLKITTEGIKKIEELGKNTKSDQCFVAMWFDEETKKLWLEGIMPIVRKAGYKPLKIDELEHIDNIVSRIISEIRQSKFMIVDLTGYRGGVYFEAGFGFGLGLPVIYTCREDKLEEVHFDLKQQNIILWKDNELPKFKTKLINRIGAVVGLNEQKVKVKQ